MSGTGEGEGVESDVAGVPGQARASATSAVVLEEIQLRDFRNYAHERISFGPRLNVLWGPNGCGKTNVLEAISYLALGRSPRGAREPDLVRRGARGFGLTARYVEQGEHRRELGISFAVGEGRALVQVDGQVARPGGARGKLPVVLFTPDDLWLLKGGPAARRATIDRLLVQRWPVYADCLLRYRRALIQRNAVLQAVRRGRADARLLAPWEAQLVQYGAEVLRRRAEAIRMLEPTVAATYAVLAGGQAVLGLRYVPALAGAVPTQTTLAAWEDALRASLERTAGADVAAGTTTTGPHRDEVEVLLEGRPMRRFASQGEQRSAVLALKFAERDLLRRQTGRVPLLLVDDVFSELDDRRRVLLVELMLREGQVFLTTVSAEARLGRPEGVWHRVSGGHVSPSTPPTPTAAG